MFNIFLLAQVLSMLERFKEENMYFLSKKKKASLYLLYIFDMPVVFSTASFFRALTSTNTFYHLNTLTRLVCASVKYEPGVFNVFELCALSQPASNLLPDWLTDKLYFDGNVASI